MDRSEAGDRRTTKEDSWNDLQEHGRFLDGDGLDGGASQVRGSRGNRALGSPVEMTEVVHRVERGREREE